MGSRREQNVQGRTKKKSRKSLTSSLNNRLPPAEVGVARLYAPEERGGSLAAERLAKGRGFKGGKGFKAHRAQQTAARRRLGST